MPDPVALYLKQIAHETRLHPRAKPASEKPQPLGIRSNKIAKAVAPIVGRIENRSRDKFGRSRVFGKSGARRLDFFHQLRVVGQVREIQNVHRPASEGGLGHARLNELYLDPERSKFIP
jgi:hypothetical protein